MPAPPSIPVRAINIRTNNAQVGNYVGIQFDDATFTVTDGNDIVRVAVKGGAGGSSAVADDVARSGSGPIDRVRGFRGILLNGADGTVPPKGGTWKIGPAGNFIADKPVMPGHFDIRDYGAVSSPVGGPYVDCTTAFQLAILAATNVDSTINSSGVVFVPPAGDGRCWYIAGTNLRNFGQPCLEISRAVKIVGVSTGMAAMSGSLVYLAPGACVRIVNGYNSSDGGEGAGAIIEGVDFICLPFTSPSLVDGWQAAHAYSVGDKIRPNRWHSLYYECIKAGTSNGPRNAAGDCSRFANTKFPPPTTMSAEQINVDAGAGTYTRTGDYTTQGFRVGQRVLFSGFANAGNNVEKVISTLTPTVLTVTDTTGLVTEIGSGDELVRACGNRWRPGRTYTPGEVIYPNTECGYTYTCSVGGRTLGLVYIGGDLDGEANTEYTQLAGEAVPIGEPNWYTDETDPRGTTLATVQEVPSGPTWVRGDADPEPVWRVDGNGHLYFAVTYSPGVYPHGSRVRPTARYDRIFIASTGGPGTSKTSTGEPAGFAGDVTFVDADGITWRPSAPSGLVVDGTCVWAARFGGAVLFCNSFAELSRFSIQQSPAAAIAVLSDTVLAVDTSQQLEFGQIADFVRCNVGLLYQCGGGVYAAGPDSNACVFQSLFYVGFRDYWGDPAEHAFLDWSFLGNYYDKCIIQACSGYAFGMMSQGNGGTIGSCYIEGAGRKSPIRGSVQIKGGTLTSSQFRSSNINFSFASLDSGITFGAFSDHTIGLRSFAYAGNYKITAITKGSLDSVFAFRSEHQYSPGTNDDPIGYAMAYGGIANWWAMQHSNSYAYAAYFISGQNADIGRGHLWFPIGFLNGSTNSHYRFGDEVAGASTGVYASVRKLGDVIERPAASGVGKFYYRVNVSGGGKWGSAFVAGATYSAGDIVVPNNGYETPNHRAFEVSVGGVAGGAEPAWDDTLTNTTVSGAVSFTTIAGAHFEYAALVQGTKVGREIQTTQCWQDSADTPETAKCPEARVRRRRSAIQTTTNVLQVIDGGALAGTLAFGEDLVLPDNSMTRIEWTIDLHKPSTADGGSIKVLGTFTRNGAGPVQILTDTITYTLSGATLALTTVQTAINGNRIELKATPQTAETLNWRIFREQFEGADS